MKKTWSHRCFVVFAAVLLLCCAIVGGTLAYLSAATSEAANEFTAPAAVQLETAAGGEVRVKTAYPVYLRANPVVYWKDEDGNVLGRTPDYSLVVTDWTQSEDDGFWYYNNIIEGSQNTQTAGSIRCTLSGETPEGYTLTLELLAETIQAYPADAAAAAGWKLPTN